ncbi:thioredoxin domain-containing protein [Orbaceae bacterium ac157xtp]
MALKKPISTDDHILGDSNAKIELVEYGDYQCPYCGDFHFTIKKLLQDFPNDLKFIFRNFPLDFHQYALHAAIASEVLDKHNKFWSMHDLLFENQNALDDQNLINYAHQLGLSAKEFETEFANKALLNKIDNDIESGLHSGVNGTPSLYINGKKYRGDYSYSVLFKLIQKLLQNQN